MYSSSGSVDTCYVGEVMPSGQSHFHDNHKCHDNGESVITIDKNESGIHWVPRF